MIASAWRRFLGSYLFFSFRRDRIAILSFVVLCTFFLASFSASLLAPFDPYDPIQIDIMDSEIPPVWMEEGDQRFLLGTDVQGRDLLSTILYGSRISITIGIFAVLLQAFLGISIGLVSGYFGGRLDNFLMRLADIQLSFSTLMVAIIF